MLGLFNVKECSASFKTLKQEATGGGVTKRPEYLVGLSTFTILIPLLGFSQVHFLILIRWVVDSRYYKKTYFISILSNLIVSFIV